MLPMSSEAHPSLKSRRSKQNRSGQKSKKGHLDGQDILTTLTNKQTRKTIEFYKFKKNEFKVTTTPVEQNTYGLIFVKQNYESRKVTTPAEQNTYGHKFMFTASLCLRQWPRSKTVGARKNDNQAKGIQTKPAYTFVWYQIGGCVKFVC